MIVQTLAVFEVLAKRKEQDFEDTEINPPILNYNEEEVLPVFIDIR